MVWRGFASNATARATGWKGKPKNLLYDGKTNVISLAKRAQVRRVDSKDNYLIKFAARS